MICTAVTKYCSGGGVEKNEMGGACSVYGGEELCLQGFGGGNLRERTTWETQV